MQNSVPSNTNNVPPSLLYIARIVSNIGLAKNLRLRGGLDLMSQPASVLLLCRGIATLSDYKEKPASSAGGEDHGQHFFAGGSEHSGQMIEGPPRKKADKESMAKQVFEAAKK